ncbi:3'-5' exonuclease [Arcanobacterium hippocoleae]
MQDAVAVSAKSDNNVNALAYTFVTERAQIAYIANEFKRLHLEQGVKYRDMAVITRSAAEHARLRRLFGEFQVNVAPEIATLPLREAPLVRDLIQLIALGIEYESEQISVSIDEVLTGRLFSYPDSRIRRIIRELHGWELHQAGMRTGREILNDITLHPDNEIYAKIPELEKIAQILNIIKQSNERGESAQRILWSIWEQLDLAQELQAQALSSSENASSANDELDAVMQLFRFVQRISEREAETTTLARLLTLLEVQDLPEDSIAKSGDNLDQIALTTAVSTVAKTWKYVAVVNINDGNWPNLKLRNPLTRVPELSSLVIHSLIAGETVKARTLLSEVVDDELRMLLMAVTRASEKLYLSAVDSNESNPSAFFSLLTTSSEVDADTVEVLEEKRKEFSS